MDTTSYIKVLTYSCTWLKMSCLVRNLMYKMSDISTLKSQAKTPFFSKFIKNKNFQGLHAESEIKNSISLTNKFFFNVLYMLYAYTLQP